ncbi:TPA: fimbrial biogenesis outer membrane usher protein [Escherichia coli]|nr:fimbrial biogenesis outer membrane usher protein [Escherichia coli]
MKQIHLSVLSLFLIVNHDSRAAQENKSIYNSSFLYLSDGEHSKDIDINSVINNSGVAPGVYSVDIFINNEGVEYNKDIDFKLSEGDVYASLSYNDLVRWGVNAPHLDENKEVRISNILNGATEKFDINKKRLYITIPQVYLKENSWFNTPPGTWNTGIPSILTSYYYTAQKNNLGNKVLQSDFLLLKNTLNLGGWQARYDGSFIKNTGMNNKWNLNHAYIQRDFDFLQGSSFSFGRNVLSGDLFDPFVFEGVQIHSEDKMLKPNLRNYGPVIKGVAYSNAVVSVKQFGSIIYQTSVPPGIFELNDFTAPSAGEVQVEIKEENGSIRKYNQTIASVPIFQRAGRFRYNIGLGKYYNPYKKAGDSEFFTGSAIIGLPSFTIYNGALISDNYCSVVFGFGGLFEQVGAVSFDVTNTLAHYNHDNRKNGYIFSTRYNKSLENTSINIVSKKHINKHSTSFEEYQNNTEKNNFTHRIKQEDSVSLMHNFTSMDWGQLTLSANRTDYWKKKTEYYLSGNYSVPLKYANIGISLNMISSTSNDKSITFSLDIPLRNISSQYNGHMSSRYLVNKNNSGGQISFNSNILNNSLSYNITNYTYNNENYFGANAVYKTQIAELKGGYSHQENSSRLTYGATGGLTIHPMGITLSKNLSPDNAYALVQTKNTNNVSIKNRNNISTDMFGFAVIPNLTPYQENSISLDVNSVANDVEFKRTNAKVIPSKGALVYLPFSANMGRKALFTLYDKNKKAIPLGAIATINKDGDVISGIVADQGQVYLTGLSEHGEINVTWNKEQSCTYNYSLKNVHDISEETLICK